MKVSLNESGNYDFANNYENLFVFSRANDTKLYLNNNIFNFKKYDFILLNKIYDSFKIEGDILLVNFEKDSLETDLNFIIP